MISPTRLGSEELAGQGRPMYAFSSIHILPFLLLMMGIFMANAPASPRSARPLASQSQPGNIRNAGRSHPTSPDRKSYYGTDDLPDLAMDQGNWKLLCDYDGPDELLYELGNDPGETNNPADREPAILSEMTGMLLGWHKSMP